MVGYLKQHEEFIKRTIETQGPEYDWKRLGEFHEIQIGYMQHERFIHLVVTLFFGLFFLMSFFLTIISEKLVFLPLDLLFLILLVPYIGHYFRLENGVQRWYHLANEIRFLSSEVDEGYPNGKRK